MAICRGWRNRFVMKNNFLVRYYQPQKDKLNLSVKTLEEAFKFLEVKGVNTKGFKKYNLGYTTEYHFNNCRHYIRQFNN